MRLRFPIYSLLLVSLPLFGQDTTTQLLYPQRTFQTERIQGEAPLMDGSPTEAAWEAVEWSGDYVQFQPNAGAAPTQLTYLKVLYDDRNLYVAFRCLDSQPDKIEQRMGRRDEFPGDWVELNIDSYHDKRTAFSFTVSASGVKGDEFVSNDGNNWDSSWNPIWEAKTQLDSAGWTAEMRIPLSQLRFSSGDDQVWGIQSTRMDFRMDERSLWQPRDRNASGWVSRFGELRGLRDLQPRRTIELQPYVVAQRATYPLEENNPFADGADNRLSAGLDARIGVTNDLTLDLTINPDFGQVEADPGALNLDGYQIFFREQRPFFVEGQNIFDFNLSQAEAGGGHTSDQLFYSRRIGGSPHRVVSSEADRRYYVDQPVNTTILGAAKFSGKTSSGLSVGLLESITEREMATIDLAGERNETVVEPFTNYQVGRVQQDFRGGDTYVGAIMTGVQRSLGDDPELGFLHREAYSGGLDFTHRWKDRAWYVSGNTVLSSVRGSKEAILETQTGFEHFFQRPDATHLEVDSSATRLNGSSGMLKVGNLGGNFIFETGATWRSPGFEINDIGFMRNADEINYFGWMARRWQEPFSIFRRFQVNGNVYTTLDFGGNLLQQTFNVNTHANFTNFMNGGAGASYVAYRASKTDLRGGPILRRSPGVEYFGYVNSDQRKKVTVGVNAYEYRTFDGTHREGSVGVWANWQPFDAVSVNISPDYSTFRRADQYVDQQDVAGGTTYLVASVDQRTFSTTLRFTYNLTPDLTLQYYGQPFISRGTYQDFKQFTGAGMAETFGERFTAFSDAAVTYDTEEGLYRIRSAEGELEVGDPDFNFIQFRSNMVIRWEYRPGSEIFLVWAQGNTASGDPTQGLLRSLGSNVFSDETRNTFLVKATYRWYR
ncbi:carbohydrate binding protein with CBM9 domain [Neolewinella xylanilytica]|uniref:Carbohydrate binding protein with CBM9 domain n=1 Tax=Neolewinella xylanilytica TaxID=1514080 RepID=A0A2S6I8I3_9BACT|nr:DUF5916 domain-containing protein [Neolewinella xylanilytica]PPK87801.1 carbohydrate binding protein with CBM9 domain [Neolewinella xylanilytica]